MGAHQYLYLFDTATYTYRVLPAYRRFKVDGDVGPVIGLIEECIQKMDGGEKMPETFALSRDVFSKALKRLEGGDSSELDYVISKVIALLCIPSNQGIDPELAIGHSPLLLYLCENNERLDGFLYGDRGKKVMVPIGGNSPDKLFTREDITEFTEQVEQLTPPEPIQDPKKDFEKLKNMLKICAVNPNLTLLFVVF